MLPWDTKRGNPAAAIDSSDWLAGLTCTQDFQKASKSILSIYQVGSRPRRARCPIRLPMDLAHDPGRMLIFIRDQ
jgi:hypothetical protein